MDVKKQNNGYCRSCDSDFVIFEPDKEIWFDESGTGYSTKLCKCPYCNKIVVLQHIEDKGLNVNFDGRYYE